MNSDDAKLFVGGISWDTNENILKEHFQSYGVVSWAVVARDQMTHKSRGFGFVWFSDSSSADDALKEKHVILGRAVEVKKAVPRSEKLQNKEQSRGSREGSSTETVTDQSRAKKIFVGGLSSNLTEDEFKAYFEKFGRINDVVVMRDNITNRPRGFGFITFDSIESADSVLQTNFHEINGKRVEVKKAIPKEGNSNNVHPPSFNSRGGKDPLPNMNFNSHYPFWDPSQYYGLYTYYDAHGYYHTYPYSNSNHGVYYPVHAPYPIYRGPRPNFYGSNSCGSFYPAGFYPVAPRGEWHDPKFTGFRTYPSSYNNNNESLHPVYPSKGLKISAAVAANGIVDSRVKAKLNRSVHGNGTVSADAEPFQMKDKA